MIMGEQERYGPGEDGTLQDFAWVDRCAGCDPNGDDGIANDGMAAIEVEGHDMFPAIIELVLTKESCDTFRAADLKPFLLRGDVTDSDLADMGIGDIVRLVVSRCYAFHTVSPDSLHLGANCPGLDETSHHGADKVEPLDAQRTKLRGIRIRGWRPCRRDILARAGGSKNNAVRAMPRVGLICHGAVKIDA